MSEQVSRFGGSFVIDPAAGKEAPDAKYPDPPFGEGPLTDTEKYYAPQHVGAEFEKLFASCWLVAGRTSDAAGPGDWFKFDIGPESLIIVRDTDQELRAFYNVCQHRGARLVDEDFGTANSFVCGFHSWAWNIDGSIKRVTDEETFAPRDLAGDLCLPQAHVNEWGGFVFVSLKEQPTPFEHWLDDIPAQLTNYNMQDMIVIGDMSVEWPVNWKVALDAFMEGYHIHRRHPEGLGWIDDFHIQHDFFANGHSRMILPVSVKSPRADDAEKLNEELRAMLEEVDLNPADFEGKASSVRAAIQEQKPKWAKARGMDFSHYTPSQLTDDWNYSFFPNVTLNIHAEGALIMRFRPHATDPEICYYDVMILAHRVNDPAYRMPRYMGAPDIDLSGEVPRPPRVYLKHGEAPLSQVLDQDAEFVPLVQKGVRSRGFKGLRLSWQERRIRAYYEEYDRYMRNSA